MLFGRWHDSHFSWKIGATSLVNVTAFGESAAVAGIDDTRKALQASAIDTRTITGSFRPRRIVTDIIRGAEQARPPQTKRLVPGVSVNVTVCHAGRANGRASSAPTELSPVGAELARPPFIRSVPLVRPTHRDALDRRSAACASRS